MKVQNMTSNNGNKVANQFIISGVLGSSILPIPAGSDDLGQLFQSYDSNIAFVSNCGDVYLDSKYWNYSKTTAKYRNQFLGETTKETQAKIDSGEYIMTNLN